MTVMQQDEGHKSETARWRSYSEQGTSVTHTEQRGSPAYVEQTVLPPVMLGSELTNKHGARGVDGGYYQHGWRSWSSLHHHPPLSQPTLPTIMSPGSLRLQYWLRIYIYGLAWTDTHTGLYRQSSPKRGGGRRESPSNIGEKYPTTL